MKKTLLLLMLITIGYNANAQTKSIKKPTGNSATATKYGALAIDRDNGFYYGWSFDQSTLANAENVALQECIKRGGNCTIVLSYSGAGCAAYRTIDGKVGTAFGWGIAKTKEAADAIATKECLKRSNGVNPTNFVWSCNTTKAAVLKEIYNASEEISSPVAIGKQVWTTKNLSVAVFRNGDPILQATTQKEWEQFCVNQTPAFCYLNFDSKNEKKFGKLYNFHAVADRRGLAPEGWHVPSKYEFETLIATLGGTKVAGVKMRSKTGWDLKDKYNFAYGNGDNSSGLNLTPSGSAGNDEYGGGGSFTHGIWLHRWWTSTPKDKRFAYFLDFNKYSEPRINDYSKNEGNAIRLVKD